MLRGLMERAWSPVGAAWRAPPSSKFVIGGSHLAYVRYFHRTPIEADFGLLPDTHSWHRKDLPTVMEKFRQTHTNISDLFSRLAVEKASLDSALQHCAERDVQDRELLSAVNNFAERQRRVEDNVRGLLDRQSKSDEVLEEGMMRLFKEKREKDQRCRMEIEGLFEESMRGAQEIEQLLRRFDIAVLPADDCSNTGLVQPASEQRPRLAPLSSVSSSPSSFSDISNPFTNSLASPTLRIFESVEKESVSLTPLDTPKRPSSSLSPSLPPDIPETKPGPQEWDFFDYEECVIWGSENKPPIKPPTSFAEFCESEVPTPADPLLYESVDDKVTIPNPEWTLNSIREIKVNGVRVLKEGGLELSVTMLDNRTGPGALEELTQNLTEYHRKTIHKLADHNPSGFVAVQSSHGKAWHRGIILKVRNHGLYNPHNEAVVRFIDSGFYEIVNIGNIRPLPTLFRHLPQQALKARLSFVELIRPSNWHYVEAFEALKALQNACAGRKLMAKLDHNSFEPLHMRLTNPGDNPDNISATINAQLLQAGLAVLLNGSQYSYIHADRATSHLLATAVMSARSNGVGIYRREEAAHEPKEEVS